MTMPTFRLSARIAVVGLLALCLLPGLFAAPAGSEDRALLLGVGEYADPGSNLPGIDLDVAIMEEVARTLNFRPEQVRVMMDENVTLKSVDRAVEDWLVKGVSADDRVLIYYSGHGAQIPDESGDEDDGADEVLTMHDVRRVTRNGRPTLAGVLVDDHFQALLKQVPSQDVLVLIDACHSGTATKNIGLEPRHMGLSQAKVKFLYYPGMPETEEKSFSVESRASVRSGYVAIAAAQDDERSLASAKGSIVTLGVRESVRGAARERQELTPEKLTDEAARFVAANVPAQNLFHPRLGGDQRLARRPLRIADIGQGRGTVRGRIEEILRRSGPLQVTSNKPRLPVGELVEFEIDVPRAGYLNVIDVGPDDEPTILFPNGDHPDNRVEPGKIRLGSQQMNFDIRATEPAGPSLVVAILTEEAVDLRATASGPRSKDGSLTSLLSTLSPLGLKTLGDRSLQAESRNKVLAGKVEIVVSPASAP
jgi:hypothetical protein